MLRSLNTGISGVRQFQTALDVIGNNLANVNTVAFKSARTDFEDALFQTLKSPIADTGTRSGTSGVQVGNGVNVSTTKVNFNQGAINQTGVATDLAINGEGFFIVRNPSTEELFATRSGDFRVDANGYVVNNSGFRLQGFTDPAGINSDYEEGATTGDIQVDKGDISALGLDATADDAGIATLNIDGAGKINILLTDGSQYTRGQILLQKFQNPNALLKQGSNLYSGLGFAGGLSDNDKLGTTPDTLGVGRIESRALEVSNVDIAREFANLITTQRAFQASARVVTTSDQILDEILRIVR